MIINSDLKLDYKDVLLRPKRSTLNSRSEVDLERTFSFPHSPKKRTWVPIMSANMDTVSSPAQAKVFAQYKLFCCLDKFFTVDELIDFSKEDWFKNCAITIGILDKDLDKLNQVISGASAKNNGINPIDRVCIDVANGYTQRFSRVVRTIRERYPDLIIIAWNVVTREMTEELILSWADIVKVGIGPWSVCTTRIQSGVWYPQLSAIIECADAAHGLGGHIVADGGLTNPGDFAKAFGAWADFTMSGGMFAWHDETPWDIIEEHGEKYKLYYGMSSDIAMEKHHGWVAGYRSSEWKAVRVPYKWPLENTIKNILGWIRSACTYIGARRIKDMPKCATFIRVSQQSNEYWGRNS